MAGRSTTRWARYAAATAAGALALVPAPAIAHGSGDGATRTVVDGLDGARGLAVLPGWHHRRSAFIVTETDGSFSLVVSRSRHDDGWSRPRTRTRVIPLGSVANGFSPAVDVGRHGTVWLLTGGGAPGSGAATLYRWRWGWSAPKAFADIGAYQATDPDPYDQEGNPTDSNPFGVAALRDGGALVADAGGNDLLRVDRHGHISTVARLKPRTVKVPTGLPATIPGEDGGDPITLPPAGTRVTAEAVATSVTVGSDGSWYVGELRGFPGTPGTAEIWKVRAGTTDATCDPRHPWGSCSRVADGLTSIMDLAAGRDGSLYAVEMSTQSWLKAELGLPGSEVGALVRIECGRDGHDGHDGYERRHGHRSPCYPSRDLAHGALNLPGGVAVAADGSVLVAGPVFGPGGVVAVRVDRR